MQFEIFYNLLTAPRTDSNTCAQVARAQSCANHVQHIERLSRATCRVTCHVVRRDRPATKFDRADIALIGALFLWLNHQPRRDQPLTASALLILFAFSSVCRKVKDINNTENISALRRWGFVLLLFVCLGFCFVLVLFCFFASRLMWNLRCESQQSVHLSQHHWCDLWTMSLYSLQIWSCLPSLTQFSHIATDLHKRGAQWKHCPLLPLHTLLLHVSISERGVLEQSIVRMLDKV